MRTHKTLDQLNYVLLQARNPDDPARVDEWRAFAARLAVPPEQIRQVDILTQRIDRDHLGDADALLVGGAGEYSVLDDDLPIRHFIEDLAAMANHAVPIFASCFGFHALTVGLGGQVIHDESHAEVGSYDLTLTNAGEIDELFAELPMEFIAQLGHKDRVAKVPSRLTVLARSDLTPIQAFRLEDRPVYATQFHPELTWQDNRQRFAGYMEQYGKLFGAQEAQHKLDSHRPGPEANNLMRRFAELFLL